MVSVTRLLLYKGITPYVYHAEYLGIRIVLLNKYAAFLEITLHLHNLGLVKHFNNDVLFGEMLLCYYDYNICIL